MRNDFKNIIIVGPDKITEKVKEEEILFSLQNQELHLQIIKDCTLTLEVEDIQNFSLVFVVNKNVKVNFLFFKKGKGNFHKESYTINADGFLTLNKICLTHSHEEEATVFLEGEGAKVYYVCKTVSVAKEKYNTQIFHRANHTECLLYNHGITCLDGSICFLVSNTVLKNIRYTKMNQNSQILTFNREKSEIKPNLFIEENEVEASHSAHIGPLEDSSLFYLESRGISKKEACKLLLKGFLLQKLIFEDKRLAQVIDMYWR